MGTVGTACRATRRDGQPCRVRALEDGYCFAHSPKLAAKRKAAHAAGGRTCPPALGASTMGLTRQRAKELVLTILWGGVFLGLGTRGRFSPPPAGGFDLCFVPPGPAGGPPLPRPKRPPKDRKNKKTAP